MRTRWPIVILSSVLGALAIEALPHVSTPRNEAVDPAWLELQSSMENMHHAMASVARSGRSDVEFAELMLPHHQAAIDMARIELLYGKDPRMRRLAQEIIADQQSEIDLMRLWLRKQGSDPQKDRP